MPPSPLPRSYRLKRRRLIQSLFDRARTDLHSRAVGCIRVVYRVLPRTMLPLQTPFQVGVSVGRRAGNAVQRNRAKRHIREGFRQAQHQFLPRLAVSESTLVMMVLFRGQVSEASERIRPDVAAAFSRVAEHVAALCSPPSQG